MNEQQQKKQVELSVTIEDQVHTHRFDTLESQQIPAYVDQSKQLNRTLEQRRAQLWGEQVQQPQVQAQPAPAQVQQPLQAPPESYKDRKEREKREKAMLKEGRQYTPNASLQTAELMRTKALNDPNMTPPDGLPAGMDEPAMAQAVKRMTEAKITPDMFSEQQFPAQSVLLRQSLYEFKSIDRLMAEQPRYFEALRQSDPLRAKKLEHCRALAKPLEAMLMLAHAAYGVSLDGAPINEKPIVEHAKSVRADALADFAQKLANEDELYAAEIEQYIDQRVTQAAPEYEQRREEFQRLYLEEHPESEWTDVPGFNYPPQYEAMEKLKGLMQEHGDVYLQHKPVLDAMLEDAAHSLEAYAVLKAQSSVMDDLQYKLLQGESAKQDSKKAAFLVTKRMDKLMKDSYDVISRFESVNDAMKVLLRGEKLNGLNVAVLAQFGYDAAPQFRQRIIDEASTNGVRTAWQNAELARLLQDPRVQVGDHSSQFVKRAASMLRQGDEDYNIALLNHLEKVKNLGDGVPDKAFYDQTRALLQPYVDKVMNWDMERALSMNDSELADYQPQLDALFCDNMFVADLMKTKHWQNGKYSMKNEMLGDRIYEYANRVSVLRALAEKSRGLALERAAKLGQLPQTAFSSYEWENKIHDASGIPAFAAQRKSIGQRQLQSQQAKQRDLEDISSPAFMEKCREQVEVGREANCFFQKGKFHDVTQSFYRVKEMRERNDTLNEEEMKLAEAMYRVNFEQYRLAGYTPEEAERDGFPYSSISEAVFRSFARFAESESGRQLTEEQFKRMVMNLGAGYSMEQGVTPPDELAAAREQNMRGVRQYKETIRVQYGYLAEKYGTSVEKVDIKYVSDHYMELFKDFANLQTDTNLLHKLPGALDMDDPADVLLMHQADYYNLMGYALVNTLNMFVNGHATEEQLTAMSQGAVINVAANREYLVAHKDEAPFGDRVNPDAVMKPVKIVD